MDLAIVPEWRVQKPLWGHPFHQMCSYMAMFPASIPHYFIDRFTRPGEVVLDPMCGRGTTPVQAAAEGRVGIGNDKNPLAFALTRAKLNAPPWPQVTRRLTELREQSQAASALHDAPSEIREIFHPDTLGQLEFLRDHLSADDRNDDAFLQGVILGSLHGGSSGYLSLPMPNTFSMSPGYIRNYAAKNRLRTPRRDVFSVVERRTRRLYSRGRPRGPGYAHRFDIREMHDRIAPDSVQLIVMSPPYLKVIKYGLYNWIRLWFLKEDSRAVDRTLDDTHTLDRYLAFMSTLLSEMHAVLNPGGLCVVVVGDVDGLNLAQTVWDRVGDSSGFSNYAILEDSIHANEKVTRIWGKERGKATDVDRLLVLYKDHLRSPVKRRADWSAPSAADGARTDSTTLEQFGDHGMVESP